MYDQKTMLPASNAARWQLALLVVFILVPVANYLPILLGISQDAFTRGSSTYVDPAGYAFSIWGLIFIGMIVFAVLQRRVADPSPDQVSAYRFLVLAGLASIAFVPISLGTNYLWGAFDLLWHLFALLAAYFALRRHVRRSATAPAYGWSYFAPSAYLGWVSAATVLSIALALQQLGVQLSDGRQAIWALALVLTLTGAGLYLLSEADGVYALTVAWALIAIGIEQRDEMLVFVAPSAGAVLLLLAVGASRLNRRPVFYATDPAAGSTE